MKPRVMLVAAEAIPLAKTGGLGDVITALGNALCREGIHVTLLIPGYLNALDQVLNLKQIDVIPDLPTKYPVRLLQGTMITGEIEVILVDSKELFQREGGPYADRDGAEFQDNGLRFATLCHVATRIAAGQTALTKPHFVHVHDWHAGLVPFLMKREKNCADVPCALTIHNLAFQGNFPFNTAPELGIDVTVLDNDDKSAVEFWGQLSFLKAGVNFADCITTVSKTYAKEILTSRFGHGFEGVLNLREDVLTAIQNGIDTDMWNPGIDHLIPRKYTENDLSGKQTAKKLLQKNMGLPVDPFAPLMVMGSRLTHQKMADVALAAIPVLLNHYPRLQVALLGCGSSEYETAFTQLAAAYPNRLAVQIGYDEMRGHLLHAGADMLLHGSRFEPFGLTPIYAMRYGTVPIASRVGGMIDTIVDADVSQSSNSVDLADMASGILFDGDQPSDMIAAVDRALHLFRKPGIWRNMQRNGMAANFGWSQSAQHYVQMYRRLVPESFKSLFDQVQSQESNSGKILHAL